MEKKVVCMDCKYYFEAGSDNGSIIKYCNYIKMKLVNTYFTDCNKKEIEK